MSDRVPSTPSIAEARKGAKRTVRLLRTRKAGKVAAARASALEKAIAAAKKAVIQAKKAGAVVGKKDWLAAPVIPQKAKRGATLPTGRPIGRLPGPKGVAAINVGALRRAAAAIQAPTAGSFNGIEMTPVTSSNVAAVGYDSEKSLLYVSFLNGSVYQYVGVAEEVFVSMLNASSKGRFVWRELRDQYQYARVA